MSAPLENNPVRAVFEMIDDAAQELERLRAGLQDATAQEALSSAGSKLRSARFEAFQAWGAPFLSGEGAQIPSRWTPGSWADGHVDLQHPDGRWLPAHDPEIIAAYWPDGTPGWLV